MRRSDSRRLKRLAILVGASGLVGQFGSCDLGQITMTQTLDGREVIIGLIRNAIIVPLDQWITDTVNSAFEEDI